MIDQPVETLIRVAGIGKTVPNGASGLTILHDISFEVKGGEAVAMSASSPAR